MCNLFGLEHHSKPIKVRDQIAALLAINAVEKTIQQNNHSWIV